MNDQSLLFISRDLKDEESQNYLNATVTFGLLSAMLIKYG